MEYNFTDIEKRWKANWNEKEVYKVPNFSEKPKCYILDMFPYPSGAGLHVGHPLGYIASDIYARYKRLKGFNVLHPMGFDAFGLPAEQYALETGQHPADTTEKNIARYREQLDNIGFCYDWSREVRTSDPKYYKWTQWIFLQLFHSWYDREQHRARPITELVEIFDISGNTAHVCPGDDTISFSADEWKTYSEIQQREVLMQYRLAYQDFAQVWWCEALGTVLANDEVVNGVSERGGHPVERKRMRQWFLRITEYADRLLTSLDNLEWSEAMKEMQRNWIGKSSGAEVKFYLSPTLPKREGGVSQPREVEGWQTAENRSYGDLKQFKQELTRNPTATEEHLWNFLRRDQLGAKFRRQHIIGSFIVDFVSLSHNLIIEVDGEIHKGQVVEDNARTENLEERGFNVMRFSNHEVLHDTEKVIKKIKQQLGLQPTSSPSGRSGGAAHITVFTTRPDTIFGVDFLVLAPEHELVDAITTPEQKNAIDEYRTYVKSRSERERMSEVKQVTGCFTGAYAIHPFTHNPVPVWIAEYVLAGYGTGAIMAVPSGDERDHAFAKHFNIPITNIFGEQYTGNEAYSSKTGKIHNSGFLTGMSVADATEAAIGALEKIEAGKRRTNYRLRDAGFSRQRYWGEPFPIVYVDDVPYGTDEDLSPTLSKGEGGVSSLPVELPYVKSYKPGPEGQGPLANLTDWVNIRTTDDSAHSASPSPSERAGERLSIKRETNTMPGYAGSSWYFLRYMDPHNDSEFASKAATDYWNQVDLYIGGTEHAVGHLLYSRMWTKALFDLGHIGFDEPFRKLLNQGMIQGSSRFAYRINGTNTFISFGKRKEQPVTEVRVDVNIVDGQELDIEAFRKWRPEYANAEFILEDGKYICGAEVEKMSKSKYNVVNPDDIVKEYGADTFRMYEMFLGPIDVSKPWDTKGIEGVHRFLKKCWRLFADEKTGWLVTDEAATEAELRILHKTLKKIGDDIERFSFNTCVSQFMICVNELTGLNCHKRAILEPLIIALTPFAPHMAEEIWQNGLKNSSTVLDAAFPVYEDIFIAENSVKYPVAVNGKTRAEMEFPIDAAQADVEQAVLGDAAVQKWMEGKTPKKFIFVKGKMINVVV
ncbi:MAG: leucine--tRNA ligase [Taibaiella sp.]|nr:leucine--tRNA ligase [Taibaiella sp.]